MTKRDGAVGRNEVLGRANKDRLLAKDVVRALGPIFRTSRFLQLPYLYALTIFLCILPLDAGTRVTGGPRLALLELRYIQSKNQMNERMKKSLSFDAAKVANTSSDRL